MTGSGLDARVGIATGEAFVGSIRAIDRWIWSAIGNTTNLAARLEALTRDLDAQVVIDETTWSAAGPSVSDFVRREGIRVRGRGAMTLYLLPRSERVEPAGRGGV